MVASGRVDAFSAHQSLGDLMLSQLKDPLHGKVQKSAVPLTHIEWYLIAPKNARRSAELVEHFNMGLQRLRANGEYQRLLKDTTKKVDPSRQE
jgi:polar amino acid transport system substrate-binding protein